MTCENGDCSCDQDYMNFERTADCDFDRSSGLPPTVVTETLLQKIGTVCGATLVGGCILLCLLILLSIFLTPLILLGIVAWKIVVWTHYLILIPFLVVGFCFLLVLRFVLSDPYPRPSPS